MRKELVEASVEPAGAELDKEVVNVLPQIELVTSGRFQNAGNDGGPLGPSSEPSESP